MQPRALRPAANYTPVGNPGDENAVSAARDNRFQAPLPADQMLHTAERCKRLQSTRLACRASSLAVEVTRLAGTCPAASRPDPMRQLLLALARLKLDGFSPLSPAMVHC